MDKSKKYIANTAWSNYMNSQKGKSDSPDWGLIGNILTAPGKYMKKKAHYNAGQDVLKNYGGTRSVKGSRFKGTTATSTPVDSSILDKAFTPEELARLKGYKAPEGLLSKTVEQGKFATGYGDKAKIAEVGEQALASGEATELGVTEASKSGLGKAGASGNVAMGTLAILLALGYGIGKRGTTLSKLNFGKRTD